MCISCFFFAVTLIVFVEYLYICLFFILLLFPAIKPTALIGSAGIGQTLTQEVIESMASFKEVI